MGRRILADAGYDVVTVNNGSAALKKVAEQKPDLIILDVYMPGYGGLEVCQRLKENFDTASIPILLSVGKLEPFKAEEAKKARADAFIVKPFEASELLTALTKLEDKIKPQAPTQKHGRFGKTLEPSAESFGDRETGWKYRLIIPSLTDSALNHDGEPAQPKSEVVQQAEVKPVEAGQESPASATVSETTLPAGLPKDITPEEIAALRAAAAAFTGRKEVEEVAVQVEEQPTPAVAQVEPVSQQVPVETQVSIETPVTLAVAGDVQPSTEPVAPIEEPAPQTEAAAEVTQALETPVAEVETANAATTEAAERDAEPVSNPDIGKWGKDADVMAALASLLPSDIEQANGASATAKQEEIPTSIAAVASAATSAPTEYIGPRWMAESVPVMEEEATLLLEQEMEKAFAAFAAAEAGRITAVAEVPAADLVAHSEIVRPVPSPELVAPPELTVPTALSAEAAFTEVKEVAYAAAAAADSISDAITPADASSTVPTPTAAASAPAPASEEEVQRRTEAELAAAWQNWKQIRESIIGSNIIGSELTSQIAGAAAAELKTTEQTTAALEEADESVAESAEAETETSDSDGPAAIASIVDSVLAELKPKLVAEIARKMKQQEKKGKQKKGKK
jgi:CheY-like chemotaxis protein